MKKVLSVLFLATIIFYFPILLNPALLLNRNNDLEEQFWPAFYFIRQQVLENQELPFWNNMWFSGTPLLPDPQFSLFYPPHIIFLFFPIDKAFILSFLLHSLLGGLGIFLLAKKGFGMSNFASIFASFLYITSPKLAGFLEAGHPGLVWSWAWLPWAILSTMMIVKTQKFLWSLVLALSLAGIFYTHTIIFAIAVLGIILIFLFFSFFLYGKNRIKSILFFIVGGIVTFGLIAIALLPQLEWLPYTTRQLLLEKRGVFPQWDGAGELFQAIFWPYHRIGDLDSEKWLPLGTVVIILGIFGFWQLSKKVKIITFVLGFFVLLAAITNLSPLYSTLLAQNWFVLARVATRIWFIPIIALVLLATYGLEVFAKRNLPKRLILFLAILCITELIFLSWTRIAISPSKVSKFVPQEIYEYLKTDKNRFRVFCVNRCLSQKEAAKYNLELVEGYNTLSQTNYYKHMWQLTGQYWNYYTLSLPPIGTYIFEKIKPDAVSLGYFNVKYIIAPYILEEANLVLEKEIQGYLVYRNKAALPRAYFVQDKKVGSEASIIKYSPNHIQVDTSKQKTSQLVLAEVASSGWQAYLNGKTKAAVQETPNALRLVNIKSDTQFVDFNYQPRSFVVGKYITLVTILFLAGYFLFRAKKAFRY